MIFRNPYKKYALSCKEEIRNVIKEHCEQCDVENFNPYECEENSKCNVCKYWKEISSYRTSMYEYGCKDIFNDNE